MNVTEKRTPKRDMNMSTFGEILRPFCERFKAIETAVLHDSLGETIDYFAYDDPFQTRLIAAHFGIVFQIATSKLAWLGMGTVNMVEIGTANKNCTTVLIDDDIYLTVISKESISQSIFYSSLKEVKAALKKEAGY